MAAVTADNTTIMEAKYTPQEGMYVDYPVAASTTMYKYTFVGLNHAGYLTSYVAPAAYTGATATGTSFRGICVEHVDNSSGSNADKTARVLVDGYFTYALSGVAVTDVGAPVFAADNATLQAGGACAKVGHIVHYDRTGYCTIKLNPYGWAEGNTLVTTGQRLDLGTVNQKILLVHGTDNHAGLLCTHATGLCSEIFACDTANGVVTIQHTADTSMGITLTGADALPLNDIVQGTVCAWHDATNAAVVCAAVGEEINAEVTTACGDTGTAAGMLDLYCEFVPVKAIPA